MAVKGSATITLTQYRDTQSVTRYYKLVTAGSSAPSKPTTKPPSSDWSDSEPACDISKTLYFCDLTIFSNGEGEYSSVSKSSSYEAAKQAYNKANDASTAAGAAQDSIDNLSDKTRSGYIETLSGSGFVQSIKTEDGGTAEVVVYGKSVQDGTPTPEAPVEIQSVESPKVMSCGTNVFDAEAFYQHYYAFKQDIYKVTVDGVECLKFRGPSGYDAGKFYLFPSNLKPNTQYVISYRGKKDSVYGYNSSGIGVKYSDGSYSYTYCADTTTFTETVFTSNANKTIISLYISYYQSDYCYLDINSICIRELGTEVEPYKGNTATLSDIVLRSTPDGTRDRIFKDTDGLWKVERNVDLISGTELTGYTENNYFVVAKPTSPVFNKAGSIALCEYLEGYAYQTAQNNRLYVRTSGKGFLIRNDLCTTTDEYLTFLRTLTIQYALYTPTYETLPDSIQEELNALTTYNPITNVMASDGVTPDIDVSFWTRDYRAKSMAENAQTSADNAQTGVDSLNDTVFGVQTFNYILDGVTIPAYKREDGTYYYILNDEEVTVAESALVHDANGDLTSYQEGGIYEDLEIITGGIEAIDKKVNGFDARETAIYNSIRENSLIARSYARFNEQSLIITNESETKIVEDLKSYLKLNSDSIIIYSNKVPAVAIGIINDSGYMEMKGTSLFIAQESRLSTVRLRSAEKIGKLALVAGSDGHVSLKEVLD